MIKQYTPIVNETHVNSWTDLLGRGSIIWIGIWLVYSTDCSRKSLLGKQIWAVRQWDKVKWDKDLSGVKNLTLGPLSKILVYILYIYYYTFDNSRNVVKTYISIQHPQTKAMCHAMKVTKNKGKDN